MNKQDKPLPTREFGFDVLYFLAAPSPAKPTSRYAHRNQ